MVLVKRLYTFMLQRFLPVLAMTFFICLFIVMMQFLFRYIDDLVGKGLAISVVAELFGYAALTMVPTALPLAVLLASLMTFGNLGEHFELTAMKSAGISLLRIMRPLIIMIVLIAIGAFFFQNNVLPIAQTKMWTLLFSMRQKSPEVEIPVRSFYDEIPGMNMYVEAKDLNTGMLHDLIIYDVTRGMDNSRIILADSGKISFTADRSRIFLQLYQGQLFENVQGGSLGFNNKSFMPFRREVFSNKRVYIPFDANFNRLDESGMRSQYIGKNIAELTVAIDSIQQRVDSIGNVYGKELKEEPYLGIPYYSNKMENHRMVRVRRPDVKAKPGAVNVDTLFAGENPAAARAMLTQALAKVKRAHDDLEFRSVVLTEEQKLMRRHDIERQKKFTLSISILLFFFIGGPLGAIIKKGGLGTPLVISIGLFIVYFIFDQSGYKMARDGRSAVWFGMWLSTMVLLPLGVIFTYKAVHDSNALELDNYVRFFVRHLHLKGRKWRRNIKRKEVVIYTVSPEIMVAAIDKFTARLDERIALRKSRPFIRRIFTAIFNEDLLQEYENMISTVSYSDNEDVLKLLNTLPLETTDRHVELVQKVCGSLRNMILTGADDASADIQARKSALARWKERAMKRAAQLCAGKSTKPEARKEEKPEQESAELSGQTADSEPVNNEEKEADVNTPASENVIKAKENKPSKDLTDNE